MADGTRIRPGFIGGLPRGGPIGKPPMMGGRVVTPLGHGGLLRGSAPGIIGVPPRGPAVVVRRRLVQPQRSFMASLTAFFGGLFIFSMLANMDDKSKIAVFTAVLLLMLLLSLCIVLI